MSSHAPAVSGDDFSLEATR
eukprot:gene23400-biopygen7287